MFFNIVNIFEEDSFAVFFFTWSGITPFIVKLEVFEKVTLFMNVILEEDDVQESEEEDKG